MPINLDSKGVRILCWSAVLAIALVVFTLHTSALAAPANSLWVANGPNVLEFGPGQLTGIKNIKPQITLSSPFSPPLMGWSSTAVAIFG
jgi:hypothetical protein